ncbi:hypothetical protein SAMN02910358_00925 [Lachnospiraceae bacterium XBB1006]|nr:hypothetical protein SAMN02910358_00925 [Lachnospiraceae bacterium XBB1006]
MADEKETQKANLQKLVYVLGKVRDMKKEAETVEEEQNSFVTEFYNAINSQIGGNNAEQFLCLLLPGIILNREDYEYEGMKGPVIEANESRLANKMFEPCQITNTDNGRTLPYQYKMALDMLTPRLNRKLALQKNKLRRLLMSKYPYNFGEEEMEYTLLEVYAKLYDEYMDELYRWKVKLSEIKDALRMAHPDPEEFENEYLKWYEDNAGDYLDSINEKKSKLLSVFSPNDMKILEGILDSGCGAELQEARQNLYNLRKITPNGGYVYPVSFEPSNWFEMIGTSFTQAELMDSPDKIAEKIQRLSTRRAALYASMCDLAPLIDESFRETSEKIKKSKQDIAAKLERVVSKNLLTPKGRTPRKPIVLSETGKNRLIAKVALPTLEIKIGTKVPLSKRTFTRLMEGAMLKEKVSLSDEAIAILNSLSDELGKHTELQKENLLLSQKLTNDVLRFVEEKGKADKGMKRYFKMLKPIKEELATLDEEIEEWNKLLNVSTVVHENRSDDALVEELLLPRVPKGFTKIEFEMDADSLDKQSEIVKSSSTITKGQKFLFNGQRSRGQFLNESLTEMIEKSKCSKIHVSMNVAKVGIVREWFNPGVFSLTGNMYRLCSELIAPKTNGVESMSDYIRGMKGMVFPCYPVSFVLARDMQIRFQYNRKVSEDTQKIFDKHANSNGGFLFFRGRDEYGKSDQAGVHTYYSDQTVTLKFDTTQVIGYYLQATAADKSTYIDDCSEEQEKDYSMSEFTEHYRQIISGR